MGILNSKTRSSRLPQLLLIITFLMHIIINTLNAKLYSICHLLALLGAHHILHVSRIRVNAQYIYYISNIGFLEEREEDEYVEVTGAAATHTSCLKRRVYNILSNVTYWPSHRQAGAPTINIQSTLRTAPICVKMFHCSVIW
jgi:hypothetical protein